MTGASQATGLGSAEAPEPSGLGPTGAIPSALKQALGELVSLCADQRDIFPDASTALEVITDTINELYGCVEDGVFGRIAADPFPLADEAFHEALRRYPEAHGPLVFLWGASGLGFRKPTAAELKQARKRWGDRTASVGRNAESRDHEDGLGPKDEHAVGSVADETPDV